MMEKRTPALTSLAFAPAPKINGSPPSGVRPSSFARLAHYELFISVCESV